MSNHSLKHTPLSDFDEHSLVSFFSDSKNDLKGYIAIHRGSTVKPAFGATRFAYYQSEQEALKDALKLSRFMSYKSALAGLNYGGAKAVIIAGKRHQKISQKQLKAYADKVNLLHGSFVTGADVGMTQANVKQVSKYSRYFVGVKGDPVKYTTLALWQSLQVCAKETFGDGDLTNRSVAIQGLGKIGSGLLEHVYRKAAKIIVADTNPQQVKAVLKRFPKVEVVNPADIHRQAVDIFSPCALSRTLNVKTIHQLKCKTIVGGANNQLENLHIGEVLFKLGILFAPDYVVNAGGLITVVDEYEYQGFSEKRILEKIRIIPETLKKILAASKRQHKAPNVVADSFAEAIFNHA